MKRLAVIPTDPVELYLESGYGEKWLREYFNPGKFFDEVYVLSPREKRNTEILGMKVFHTQPEQLQSKLRELKIDIVRAYGGFEPCEMACQNKVNGVPVIVSVHDTNPKLLWDSIAKADVVFCMSEVVKKLVLTKFPEENRNWILPNRIHFDCMRPYTEEDVKDIGAQYPFKYKILHVGRKRKQKNLDSLIKALPILGKEYCVIAVGKGSNDEYIKLAEELGVGQRCFFIEAIESKELARYYSWADCMCTPSRWEGFGMVFTEALACASIVITSEIAPMTEYIQHGNNGLLVKDYENPQAIADMIKLACTDKQVRNTLKKNARKSVERFEQSKIDALEVDYYKKVLEMNRRGDFRMSLYEKMLSSRIGKNMKRILPVSIKKAALSVVRWN